MTHLSKVSVYLLKIIFHPHKQIFINTSLQVIVIEIKLNYTFTIVSFYLPPCDDINKQEWLYVFNSITTPKLVIGDFNAWNVLWISLATNVRGKLIEEVML